MVPAWGLVVYVSVLAFSAQAASNGKEDPTMSLAITSSAFQAGAKIPSRYTGDSADVSPPLSFEHIPPDARALVLICDDPDAPTPEPWVHWVIYGIAPQTKGLPEGITASDKSRLPEGALQGKNSWKTTGYRGPAPPSGHGVHHYHFKLYALDRDLTLKPGLDKSAVLKAIQGHVLATGELIGTYERK